MQKIRNFEIIFIGKDVFKLKDQINHSNLQSNINLIEQIGSNKNKKDIDKKNRHNFYKDILFKHLEIIKPKYILLLGENTYNLLNNSNKKILEVHGKWDSIVINKDKFITLTTFDPEILLSKPENKKLSWEDLKKFRNEIYKN